MRWSMTRRMKGTLGGLALLAFGACTGGGSPNDFGTGPSDNAPTDPGAPSDPNAPPGDGQLPPFGGTAPPGPSVPGDGATGADCNLLCNQCASQVNADTLEDCVEWCHAFPASCFPQVSAVVDCYIGNGCEDDDNCDAEAVALVWCVGPGVDETDGPGDDGGEGGQGGI